MKLGVVAGLLYEAVGWSLCSALVAAVCVGCVAEERSSEAISEISTVSLWREPSVTITSPSHGDSLGFGTNRVAVRGRVRDLDPAANYELYINGEQVTLTVDASGRGTFSTSAFAYPEDSDERNADEIPRAYPFPHWADDTLRYYRPFRATLMDADSGRIVARDRVLLREHRWAESLSATIPSDLGEVDTHHAESIAFQLTPSGIDTLEPILEELRTHPDHGTLDDRLRTAIGSGATAWSEAVESCYRYSRLDSSLQSLVASDYSTLKTSVDLVLRPLPLVDASEEDDYDLCIDSVHFTIVEITTGEPDFDLNVDEDVLEATTNIPDVLVTVDATFTGHVEFVGRGFTDLPERVLSSLIGMSNTVDEPLTCEGLSLRDTRIRFRADTASLEPSGWLPVRDSIRRVGDAPGTQVNGTLSATGLCSSAPLDGLVNEAEEYAEDEAALLLEEAWHQEAVSETELYGLLDDVFSPFEINQPISTEPFAVAALITSIEERADNPVISAGTELEDHFGIRWELGSSVRVTDPASVAFDHFFKMGSEVPVFGGDWAAPTNSDFTFPPYDLAVTVTTRLINQVLAAAASSSLLSTTLQPTWNDLGICDRAPTGADCDEALTTGTELANWIPELEEAGDRELEVVLYPTLPPTVLMAFQTSDAFAGEAPVKLTVGQYKIIVRETSGRRPQLRRTWLELDVDVFDSQVELALGSLDGHLDADIDATELDVAVHRFATSTAPADHGLEASTLLETYLIAPMEAAVEHISVPEFEALPRRSEPAFRFEAMRTHSFRDAVTFFVNLR